MESSAVFEGAGAIKSPGSVDELLEDFVLDGIVGFDFVEETPTQQVVFRLLLEVEMGESFGVEMSFDKFGSIWISLFGFHENNMNDCFINCKN